MRIGCNTVVIRSSRGSVLCGTKETGEISDGTSGGVRIGIELKNTASDVIDVNIVE